VNTALKQLGATPGVVGSLVFDGSGQLLASAFPPVFEEQTLGRLATTLALDGYFQDWTRGEQAAYSLRYAEGWVHLRPVGAAWLMVLSTPQVNAQLLNMSLIQVLRRLRAPAPQPGPAAPAPPPPPQPAPATAPIAPTPAELLKALARAELGEQAAQALEMLAAAGNDRKQLLRAAADIEKMTRLFINKKKAEDLGRMMREVLG
jgi:predicted regulator of Ras-like GTPase activity (Roadblock/LC7/MglB family)